MKKIIFSLAVTGMVLTGMGYANTSKPAVAEEKHDHKWNKDDDGIWTGVNEGKTYWYKLDKTKLMWSTDGKDWKGVPGEMWMDNERHVLTVKENKLQWSADSGKTWTEVPDWKWQAADGKWYKFDKEWNLWVATL